VTGLDVMTRTPRPGFAAIERLADATGIMQHSRLGVPDPDHGYCVDDNARALILMHRRNADPLHDPWTNVFANFVARAWNPERGRFRNFMSHDGVWLEQEGSQDSQGRALWSLGVTAAEARAPALRAWALDLFEEAAPPLRGIGSPRAIAFAILGAAAMLDRAPGHAGATELAAAFATRGRAGPGSSAGWPMTMAACPRRCCAPAWLSAATISPRSAWRRSAGWRRGRSRLRAISAPPAA
jgi:hypothetical protein